MHIINMRINSDHYTKKNTRENKTKILSCISYQSIQITGLPGNIDRWRIDDRRRLDIIAVADLLRAVVD